MDRQHHLWKPHEYTIHPAIFLMFTENITRHFFQERIRNGSTPKPEPGSLEDILVYNSGNFGEAVILSNISDFLLTGVYSSINYIFRKTLGEDHLYTKKVEQTLKKALWYGYITSAISGATIMSYIEFSNTIKQTQDIKDIPAAILGAAIYGFLRYNDNKLTEHRNSMLYPQKEPKQIVKISI